MAICEWCKQEMSYGIGCTQNSLIVYPDNTTLPSIPAINTCHDCFSPPNMKHHPGCDAEKCPRCWGQLISCECLDEEDED